jgi:acetylornithine deacetylase/succinyl-diaminopimelate desuccinylase-like protein
MSLEERFRNEALEQLKELLRIPSISALPEHKDDIQKAADFVEAALKRAGMSTTTQVRRGDGNPLVYGAWTGAPGKPTVLLYGHYDVQPPDPLEEWTSPPFEPTLRGDDLFGRGTSDDKGQTWILIKAVERLMHLDGTLPVNVKFLIEGEEESGGESIETYVAEKPAELACDAVVICDTEMFAAGLPTLTTGLRGLVYGEIAVEGARQDLHSGSYGGAAPNVLMAIAEILTALKHRDGRVLIPRFYERVKAPAEAELAAWRSLPFNEVEYREKEVGSVALTGEPGYSVLERVWARPTFEVHGIRGGFVGEGAKTVIPARATVKISTRLVPDQQPDEIVALLKEAIAAACPRGVKAEFKLLSAAPASVVDVSSPFISKACEALDAVFGTQDRIHALRRLDSDCRLVPRAPGRAERADGLRPAGRQPAFAEREVPPAEPVSRHRVGDEVSRVAGAIAFYFLVSSNVPSFPPY